MVVKEMITDSLSLPFSPFEKGWQYLGLVRTLDNLETNDKQNSDEQSLIILVYGLVPYFQNSVQTSKLLFPSEMTEVKPDPEHVEVLKRYFGHSKFRP